MTLLAAPSRAPSPHPKPYTLDPIPCAHCSLPVPAGLLDPAATEQFCCQGCRTVFAVIHSCRMDQYYAYLQRDRAAGGTSTPARVTGKAYREFDDPAFLDLHAPLSAQNTRTIDFYLEGVHCTACVWLVEKLPALLPNILESRLNLGKQLVRITWLDTPSDSSLITHPSSLSHIARTLDSLGYAPHPARSSTARQVRTADDRRQLIRIGVAGAAAGNTMLLAVALYAGLFAAMEPGYLLFFRWLSMLIGITALAWPGSVFFKGALAALRTRTPHLDLPIALGLAAGGIVGTINTLRNSGEIYFDSLSVLVFLLLVGRFLQHRQQGLADDAVERLFSLTPMSAHKLLEDGTLADVPIASLKLHDTVQVQPGESLPVDGTLLDWSPNLKLETRNSKLSLTTIDESLLTGESFPKSLQSGDPVHAGTTNLSSPIRVQVRATGEATRVGKLMRLVTECARRKAPMVLFADRIAGRFLIGVLAIALAVFAVWFFRGTHSAAVDHAVAILIVACPCALGLATPLAVTIAIGRAARRGILIKGGETLERLARPGLLLLDKTGTLTTGQISVQHWECLAADEDEIRAAIAAIESQATHPVARALAAFARKTQGLHALGATDSRPDCTAIRISQDMTGGITGTVGGHTYAIGSQTFIQNMLDNSIPIENQKWGGAKIENLLSHALSPILILRDGQLVALAGVGDTLRPDAAASLAALRQQGWHIGILSGDHPAIVHHIAQQLSIDPAHAHGGLLPEQKLAHIRTHLAQSANPNSKLETQILKLTVVMVGDGVNDAAALAAAHVGIAVHGGAEASLAAAGIYLNQPGLAPILDVMHAARSTVSVIRRSLAASLTYNALAITLAALGLINPLVAAILMPVSSLTVLSLAFGSRTFKVRSSSFSLPSPQTRGARIPALTSAAGVAP